jgi:hypothetical protein
MKTYDELGEYWDDHDFTDHDTKNPDVNFTITQPVMIDAHLYVKLLYRAQKMNISLERLVNQWLKEKLQ